MNKIVIYKQLAKQFIVSKEFSDLGYLDSFVRDLLIVSRIYYKSLYRIANSGSNRSKRETFLKETLGAYLLTAHARALVEIVVSNGDIVLLKKVVGEVMSNIVEIEVSLSPFIDYSQEIKSLIAKYIRKMHPYTSGNISIVNVMSAENTPLDKYLLPAFAPEEIQGSAGEKRKAMLNELFKVSLKYNVGE